MERQTQTIDATGQVLGRLASQVAMILRGKTKPNWQPHLDMGDAVEITNISNMVVTGKKMTGKTYYKHTGHPGGIRSATMAELIGKKGHKAVFEKAVFGMLPDNQLRKLMMMRLTFKK